MDFDRSLRSHPSAEALEELALNRLPDGITSRLEEHLLICALCQDRLAEIDTFITTFRAAAAEPRRDTARAEDYWSWLPAMAMRKTSIAPILVLAILVLLMVRMTPPDPQLPVGVSLVSMRGDTDVFAPAPAGKPLRLSVDATGVRMEERYRLEIVDGAGGAVWQGSAARAGAKLSALIPKPLLRGVYWVRLYGENSELLQEYGLSAN